jgi:outer membrane protein OmpA-like peptidoglycan-associated protein
MSSQADETQGLVLGVVFGVIAMVIAFVIGISVYAKGVQSVPAPASAAPAAAVSAAIGAGADSASVAIENGVVKFYFASAKTDLAGGANEALAAVVAGSKGGKKVLVSGFHDASGDAAINAELAKQRAVAVRDALQQLGVAADHIELKKPEQTQAAGPAEQARRVEVTLE